MCICILHMHMCTMSSPLPGEVCTDDTIKFILDASCALHDPLKQIYTLTHYRTPATCAILTILTDVGQLVMGIAYNNKLCIFNYIRRFMEKNKQVTHNFVIS